MGGGVRDLVAFQQRTRFRDAWYEAASAYVRMPATPQLFIEGNHRIGGLIVSYMLLRAGFAPIVPDADRAAAFFRPAAELSRLKRRRLGMLLKRGRLQRYFIQLFKEAVRPGCLVQRR